ncbi:unknown [Clostridium sp. CAG:1024]|nr:unknown [Clostridium sp. CAG:1024]
MQDRTGRRRIVSRNAAEGEESHNCSIEKRGGSEAAADRGIRFGLGQGAGDAGKNNAKTGVSTK